MALTKNLKCTAKARQIEKADFLDSITQHVPLTDAERVDVLRIVKASLIRNATESPEFASGLLVQAAKVQAQIDGLIMPMDGPQWTPAVFAAGEDELGTRAIISGGDVLEIDAPAITSSRDEFPF